MDDVELRATDASDPDARWVMTEFFAELDRRFPSGFAGEEALREAPLTLSPPNGVYVVVMVDSTCAGGGGLYWLDETRAEIKRVWVAPGHRGRGLSTALMADLESRAAGAGRTTVVLDTNGVLVEAVALYERLGYSATTRYNDNPYATHWFTKQLAP